jgi:hypothetical protein
MADFSFFRVPAKLVCAGRMKKEKLLRYSVIDFLLYDFGKVRISEANPHGTSIKTKGHCISSGFSFLGRRHELA